MPVSRAWNASLHMPVIDAYFLCLVAFWAYVFAHVIFLRNLGYLDVCKNTLGPIIYPRGFIKK